MAQKKIVTTRDPAVAAARKQWDALRNGMMNSEKAIINIIRSRAWEPLGYESFSKAWVEEMSDITLAIELIPHIIYQLFDEGFTVDDAADAIKGIGRSRAQALKRQKDNGVPAELATTKAPKRRTQLPYVRMSMRVPREQLNDWRRKARRDHVSVEGVVYNAAVQAFDQL